MENFLRNDLPPVLEPESTNREDDAPEEAGRNSSLEGNHQGKGLGLFCILDRPAITAFIIGVAGLTFFLAGIGRPPSLYYDEGFFVPEARNFLHNTPYPDSVIEMHSLAKPPLGKIMIALSMRLAGDNPFGWRVASAFCGAMALVAVYLWALLLLQDRRLARFAAGLTLFNNFLFVMSRIGMMDVFLVVFLMWSFVAYTAAIVLNLSTRKRRILLICSGTLMGLAGACKWNAIDSLAVLWFVSAALLWLAHRSTTDSISPLSDQARNVQKIGPLTLILGLVLAPLVTYVLTFWPQCRVLEKPFSVHELIALHRIAWQICTTWTSNPTLTSVWYMWPLSLSPQRGLSYLLGNPIVTWGGLAATTFCLWRFRKSAGFPEGLVLLLFGANFLQWAVTPEKGLFYYYYFPAVMILGMAIAVAVKGLPRTIYGMRLTLVVLLAAAIVFLWCYPRMAHLEAPWDCVLGCWL